MRLNAKKETYFICFEHSHSYLIARQESRIHNIFIQRIETNYWMIIISERY
jgi:hypothetical protein